MAPNVVFQRRHIEVANQNGALEAARPDRAAVAHLVEERELVGELRINLDIRQVATGWNVKIVDGDGIAQTSTLAQNCGNVPAIGLATKDLHIKSVKRQP